MIWNHFYVVDMLHLFLRISEKLFDLFINDLKILDVWMLQKPKRHV